MGIQYRDYMQDEPVRGYGRRGTAFDAVKLLIIANVVVFVAQVVGGPWVEEWLALDPDAVLHGQIWRLLSYEFLHSTDGSLPMHLLVNMYLLYLAGRRVQDLVGPREFLAFYLTAGVASGVVFLLWGLLIDKGAAAIGASGAVVAVLIVYAVNWPQERWYFFGIIPISVMWIAILSALFDVYPMLQQLGGRQPQGNVAHAAHVGGMLFGYVYARRRWELTRLLEKGGRNWRNPFRSRPRLRVHHPEVEEFPDVGGEIPVQIKNRVDLLLQKITDYGEASLTSEERAFLADASRRYRQQG